jgi:peptide/nickel transport system permease protein
VPLEWFSAGHIVRSSNESAAPLLLLGADSYGRDVFTRLLFGARTSLALAATAALGATLIGAILGGLAGFAGGLIDDAVMRTTDFVMVLPTIYVALALRAVLPLVLTGPQVFALLAAIFAVVGAPFVARGVRAIVRSERRLEYASAAQALGASDLRLLVRHLLPAARGFLAVQMTLLIPAFIIAEATLSYVGLGFPDPVASWGTMLHDASSNIRVFADFPWLLSPAAAMFLVVLGVNLVLQDGRPAAFAEGYGEPRRSSPD